MNRRNEMTAIVELVPAIVQDLPLKVLLLGDEIAREDIGYSKGERWL